MVSNNQSNVTFRIDDKNPVKDDEIGVATLKVVDLISSVDINLLLADGKSAGTLSVSGTWTGYSQEDFEALQMGGGVGGDTPVVESTTVSGETTKETNKGGKNQQQKGGKGKNKGK